MENEEHPLERWWWRKWVGKTAMVLLVILMEVANLAMAKMSEDAAKNGHKIKCITFSVIEFVIECVILGNLIWEIMKQWA